jgi:hypothetical protein
LPDAKAEPFGLRSAVVNSNRRRGVTKVRLMNRSVFLAALLAICIGVMGCGGGAPASSGGAQTPGSSPTEGAPVQTKGKATSIHLVITGGAGAGTFDLNSSDKCTYVKEATTNMMIWGVGYSDTESNKIVSLTIAVNIATKPPTFTFGAITQSLSGQQYNLSTVVAGFGTGSAEVQDRGLTVKISLTGTTKEGYGVTATVQCNEVDRIN